MNQPRRLEITMRRQGGDRLIGVGWQRHLTGPGPHLVIGIGTRAVTVTVRRLLASNQQSDLEQWMDRVRQRTTTDHEEGEDQ